ncbi:hypothetical protein Bca52824_062236 [Brassica carinata]|uniref:Uncharacterized protein n=1 Tax=Brassica carinata TaxID=52824 RepID=A0A8X7U973_BRACI|nr:hypothetical protein Bca52824_062236 [Brassica carinata]
MGFTWMFWTLWEPRPKKWCHMVFWYLDAAQDRVVRSRRKVSISSTGLFKPVADKRLGVGEGLELLFHGDTDMMPVVGIDEDPAYAITGYH